jgi:hypothetical protein
MRKLTLAVASLVALVAAGVAVAHGIEGARTATAVSSTFTAAAGNVQSNTCTTSDNKTIVSTRGTYTGTSNGSTDLTGAITIDAKSVINSTDDVGTVSGRVKIGDGTKANFSAVYDHGNLAGLAVGHTKAPAALLANLSATFSTTSGFGSGKIGGGTGAGSAVEIGRASCASSSPTHERSSARGTISAISASSITVAGLTCTTPNDLTSQYKVNDTVSIDCSYANGTNTLTKISGLQHGAKHNVREDRDSHGKKNGKRHH